MTERLKPGPKPKPKGQKQTERFLVYLTPAQAKLLQRDCKGRGMTPSAFFTDLWLEWRAGQEG